VTSLPIPCYLKPSNLDINVDQDVNATWGLTLTTLIAAKNPPTTLRKGGNKPDTSFVTSNAAINPFQAGFASDCGSLCVGRCDKAAASGSKPETDGCESDCAGMGITVEGISDRDTIG
jgi:hypothetical protein